MDQLSRFNTCLRRRGLKNTSQRLAILQAFLKSTSHNSTEDLYLELRKQHPRIGYATVHRTLKLLAECGLAIELNFGDGQTRYEPYDADQHHDHLVCTGCGRIIEFSEPAIEKLQDQVAARHDFLIRSHRHELYGLCSHCADETSSPPSGS